MVELLHYALDPLLAYDVNLVDLVLLVYSLPEYSEQWLTLLCFLVNEFYLVHGRVAHDLHDPAVLVPPLKGVLHVRARLRVPFPHLYLNLEQ